MIIDYDTTISELIVSTFGERKKEKVASLDFYTNSCQ